MDILKKTLQFGFGLAYIGKEHLEALMKDLKDKYNLDEKQSKKLAKDIIKHSMESHKKVKILVEKHVKDFLKEADKVVSKPKKKVVKKKKPVKRKTTKKRVVKRKKPAKRKKATKRKTKKTRKRR